MTPIHRMVGNSSILTNVRGGANVTQVIKIADDAATAVNSRAMKLNVRITPNIHIESPPILGVDLKYLAELFAPQGTLQAEREESGRNHRPRTGANSPFEELLVSGYESGKSVLPQQLTAASFTSPGASIVPVGSSERMAEPIKGMHLPEDYRFSNRL